MLSGAGRSLSDQVAQRISDDYIMSGKVPAGELLPSEFELCAIYGISRVTIRAAVHSLWDHGLISVRQGIGAVVLPCAKEIRHGLDRLNSLDTFARETGHRIDTGHLQWETAAADASVAQKLQMQLGAPVLQVKRSKIVDGVPVAWIIDTLPLAAIDEKGLRRKFKGSMLDALLADGRYPIDYADSVVRPCLAEGHVKEILAGDENGLLLFLDTTTMMAGGVPILWGQIWFHPSHLILSFLRRRLR